MNLEQYKAEASRLKRELKNLNTSRASLTDPEEIEAARSQVHKLQVEYNDVLQKIKEIKDDYEWKKSIDREFNSFMTKNKVDIRVNDITTVCNKIVTDILSKMNREKVSTIKSDKSVREKPILYRWWFHADFVDTLIDKFKNLEISDLEPKKMADGKVYYALYFGKSENGLTRFKAHTSGNSTLRRTLYAICKDDINNLINDCYFEWVEVENEKLLECLESMCIVSGKYPLNIKGNPSCQDWIVEARKKNNKSK